MNQANELSNHFLIAMPALKDFNFSKTVVYIHEHDEDGALGVIINKPTPFNLGKVLDHLSIKYQQDQFDGIPVLLGGPVGQEHGFIVHETATAVSVSASKDLLCSIAKGQGPNNYMVTLGYSGWAAGQIEEEIARNDWLIAPFSREILFDVPIERRWESCADLIGININMLSNQVGHA